MNVPKLRFKDFTDECSTKKLKSICSFYSGGTPASTNKDFYSGNIPFIRSGEIHSENAELFVSEEAIKNSSAKYVEKGDLLLALYGATSGDIAISKINGVINQAILCIRPSKFYDKNYIKYIFESKKYKILNIYLQGGQGNLSADIIKNIKFDFCSFEEQTKIANFLSLLDKKIELQTKKIEALKLYKKGLDKFIFSNEFLFNKEELALHFDSVGGTALEKYISENGTHKIISIGNYSPDGEYIDNNQKILLNEKTKTKLLNKSNLVMILNDKTTTGDIIGSTILIDKNDTYIYNQRSQKLICKNINPQYAWCFLNSYLFRKRVFKLSQGGTQIYINFSTLEKQNILIPKDNIIEKRIITSIIGIKNKITIENKKLDSLKKIKKGLLQNMFV